MDEGTAPLRRAQAALRSRFDDFRQALERRDRAAYRLALADFQQALGRWTAEEERHLVPALERAPVAGRDSRRELTLEFVQLRELTRQLRFQLEASAPLADVQGLVENLSRRFDAHERGVLEVYYPAASAALSPEEREALARAARAL
ncbi:MAG TPA: hemerythrin domain-containing protein [Thermoanaerobaculia bacterium]|nr:hemerythrin domain-containing protein [Thermoanaerobaculia bacterium]